MFVLVEEFQELPLFFDLLLVEIAEEIQVLALWVVLSSSDFPDEVGLVVDDLLKSLSSNQFFHLGVVIDKAVLDGVQELFVLFFRPIYVNPLFSDRLQSSSEEFGLDFLLDLGFSLV